MATTSDQPIASIGESWTALGILEAGYYFVYMRTRDRYPEKDKLKKTRWRLIWELAPTTQSMKNLGSDRLFMQVLELIQPFKSALRPRWYFNARGFFAWFVHVRMLLGIWLLTGCFGIDSRVRYLLQVTAKVATKFIKLPVSARCSWCQKFADLQ